MRIKILLISSMCILFIGCTDTNDQSQNNHSPEIKHSRYSPSDNHPNQTKRNQTRHNQGKTDDNGGNDDIFTNDITQEVQETLNDRQDIRKSQVAITDTRALIAVQLSKNADREKILDNIENDIKHIVPKKEIVIYTEDSYYDRMKNLGSQLKRLTDDDDIDKYIDEYFTE